MTEDNRQAAAEPSGTSPVDPAVLDPAVVVLDERGRICPQPVIALGRASKAAPPGSRIDLLADDPAAESDVPAWCRMTGADFLGSEVLGSEVLGAEVPEADPLGSEVGTLPRRYRVRTRQWAAPDAQA